MKALGIIGMLLTMWGIIWGIFLRGFVWLSVIGIMIMCFCVIFDEEN
jgi:hypothetical protein